MNVEVETVPPKKRIVRRPKTTTKAAEPTGLPPSSGTEEHLNPITGANDTATSYGPPVPFTPHTNALKQSSKNAPKVQIVPTVTADSIASFILELFAGQIQVHGPTMYLYSQAQCRWRHFPVVGAAKHSDLYALVASAEKPIRDSFLEYSPGVQSKLASTLMKMLVWNSTGYAKLCARIVAAAIVPAKDCPPSTEKCPFDSDPNLLGFENGVLDLTTRELLGFRIDLLVSMSTGYHYVQPTEEETEQCAAIFEGWFPEYDDQVDCLQVLAGGLDGHHYPAIFSQCDHVCFVTMMGDVLGPEYFRIAGDNMWSGSDRAWLDRVRMVYIADACLPDASKVDKDRSKMYIKLCATFTASGTPIESKKHTFPLRCTVFGGGFPSKIDKDNQTIPIPSRAALLNLLLGVRGAFAVDSVMQFDPRVMALPTITTVPAVGAGVKKPSEKKSKEKESTVAAVDWIPLNPQSVNKYGLTYRHSNVGSMSVPSLEIGVDEVGRGPLFGRTYVAAAVLPPVETITQEQAKTFDQVRDSKKISSKAKMRDLAERIKVACPFWSIQFQEAADIDRLNITQAIVESIGVAVDAVIGSAVTTNGQAQMGASLDQVHILADGHDFTGHWYLGTKVRVSNFDKGDNRFVAIACAAILAKDAHDTYILALCEERPELVTKYCMNTNMGYGTAAHMEGIRVHGVTDLHRRSFAPVRRSIEAATGHPLTVGGSGIGFGSGSQYATPRTAAGEVVCLFDNETVST